MNRVKTTLFFLCLLGFYSASAQATSEYIIVRYEVNRTYDQHGRLNYYWVIPSKQLLNNNVQLAPLFLKGFDTSRLRTCCNDSVTSIFSSTAKSKFDFSDSYKAEVNDLISIIAAKQRKTQTITKIWPKKGKETINVYLTPVIGHMCNCEIDKSDGASFDYYGRIFLPNGRFVFSDKFWIGNGAQSPFLQDIIKTKTYTGPL